jgi:uncharacterized protein (TIGR01619 family)
MSDEWDFYRLQVDDQPASIFLDMGIARLAPLDTHASMAYLRVHMLHPTEDGLSSQVEFEDLIALEDAVIAEITADGATIYVGRNTSRSNRDFYFYTAEAALFEAAATDAMSAFPAYSFETGGRADPEWRAYFEFLFPSPRSRQQMANRDVIRNLESHGDLLDESRQIDHLAIFGRAADCDAFARLVSGQGFVTADPCRRANDGRFHLEFSRLDRPRDIDDVSIPLFEAALNHDGDYDGWGCTVVTEARR